MELYQLRALIAVAEHGQLQRASEHLHLTLSALSKQIKSLESELGLLLFERTREGMLLTPAGRHLLPAATEAVRWTQQITTQAASIAGQLVGSLRLGTIIDPEAIRLGPLTAQLLKLHPHVDIALVHGVSGGVFKLLREGEIDACFYLGLPKVAQVAVRPLRLEHYVIIGPPAWEERLRTATWHDLAEMPWLVTPAGTAQRELIGQIFATRGLTCRAVVETDHEASMLGLMRAELGLALVRERAALPMRERGQVVVWHGARLPCPLSLLYRHDDAHRDLIQSLLSIVAVVWQDERGTV